MRPPPAIHWCSLGIARRRRSRNPLVLLLLLLLRRRSVVVAVVIVLTTALCVLNALGTSTTFRDDVGRYKSLLLFELPWSWSEMSSPPSTTNRRIDGVVRGAPPARRPPIPDRRGWTVDGVLVPPWRDDSNDERDDDNIDESKHHDEPRAWGCRPLTTAPFVFVHIGKAGGGVVRRRFASAARNVTRRPSLWWDGTADRHYYPIMVNSNNDGIAEGRGSHNATTTATSVVGRAVFCSSGRRRHLPVGRHWSVEGYSQRCTAQTLLGHVLACPEALDDACGPVRSPVDPEAAHLVYAGHNYVGTELHWLPIPTLKEWWGTYWSPSLVTTNTTDPVLTAIDNLDGIRPWCGGRPRPLHIDNYEDANLDQRWDCAQRNIEPRADAWARRAIRSRVERDAGATPTTPPKLTPRQWGRAYGHMYASLPVVRVTLLREPWAWMSSKYAWHEIGTVHGMNCSDVSTATTMGPMPADMAAVSKLTTTTTNAPTTAPAKATTPGNGTENVYADLHLQDRPGWLRLYALKYIMFLCGEDCHARLEAGHAPLEEIEAQAAYNLRHSFAVVGLLHQQDVFLDMVHARVEYMDLHQLNSNVPTGGEHKSDKENDAYCSARFHDPAYQQSVLAVAPEMQALLRLYEIGVQVNQFQLRELEQCSGRPFAAASST